MKDKAMFLLPIFFLFFIVLFFAYRWWKSKTQIEVLPSPTPTLQLEERDRTLLKKFGVSETNSVSLNSVTSADVSGAISWSADKKSLTVAATLPDLSKGFYQVWMDKGDGTLVPLGRMRKEKAGYLFDYVPPTPLSSSLTIVVSKELRDDAAIETQLLEGKLSL